MASVLDETQLCSAYACPNEWPCDLHPGFPPAEKRLGAGRGLKDGPIPAGAPLCRRPGCREPIVSIASRGRYANLCQTHYDEERQKARDANAAARELPDLRAAPDPPDPEPAPLPDPDRAEADELLALAERATRIAVAATDLAGALEETARLRGELEEAVDLLEPPSYPPPRDAG